MVQGFVSTVADVALIDAAKTAGSATARPPTQADQAERDQHRAAHHQRDPDRFDRPISRTDRSKAVITVVGLAGLPIQAGARAAFGGQRRNGQRQVAVRERRQAELTRLNTTEATICATLVIDAGEDADRDEDRVVGDAEDGLDHARRPRTAAGTGRAPARTAAASCAGSPWSPVAGAKPSPSTVCRLTRVSTAVIQTRHCCSRSSPSRPISTVERDLGRRAVVLPSSSHRPEAEQQVHRGPAGDHQRQPEHQPDVAPDDQEAAVEDLPDGQRSEWDQRGARRIQHRAAGAADPGDTARAPGRCDPRTRPGGRGVRCSGRRMPPRQCVISARSGVA